jgi:hypothetical protein
MSIRVCVVSMLLSAILSLAAVAEDGVGVSTKYKALKHSPADAAGTWAILDRDGANRQVDRYLSSLGGGESGTGVIVSPPFKVSADAITFTICGHDGQGGGQQKNFIALVDVRSGKILKQTPAPGSDPMQQKSWEVGPLRGREVRIEVHDGDPGGAFAWLGVGEIDAGPALRVRFRDGMPDGWIARTAPAEPRTEVVRGGVPFLRYPAEYTMIPASGAREMPCGFAAERLFVLGCLVPTGKPLEIYGEIEIVYRQGPAQRFPLMCGYTLDIAGKLLSKSKAVYLHESGDVFQPYLVLAPRPEVIEKIILRRNPKQDSVPQITAITCQTQSAGDNLAALPDYTASPEEEAWIRSHTITPSSPSLEEIMKEIRRAHKLP